MNSVSKRMARTEAGLARDFAASRKHVDEFTVLDVEARRGIRVNFYERFGLRVIETANAARLRARLILHEQAPRR